MVLTASSLDLSSIYNSKGSSKSTDSIVAERPSALRKGSSKSRMKRSTVLLDDNMVREYNLAIRELDYSHRCNKPLAAAEMSASRQNESVMTHRSAVSTSSSMSSLFSRESSVSIHDILYHDCEEEEMREGNAMADQWFLTPGLESSKQLTWALDDQPQKCTRRTQLDFF